MNRKVQIGDPPIRILRNDLEKIENLLDSLHRSYSRISLFLQNEVMRADIVDAAVKGQFVHLGSHVSFTDEAGRAHAGTLFMPEEGQPNPPDGISILTPVGCALLGLSPGQTISYDTIDSRTKQITVQAVQNPSD